MEKLIKFKKEIIFDIGTIFTNPSEITSKIPTRQQRLWIKYENQWYLTRMLPSIGEDKILVNKIKKECYNKEQLEEILISSL